MPVRPEVVAVQEHEYYARRHGVSFGSASIRVKLPNGA
jgi:hypothetical protein